MAFIDSHCHLDFKDFQEDIHHVLDRAHQAGVTTMLSICTRLGDADAIIRLADANPSIFASIGIHPHEVDKHPSVSMHDMTVYTHHPKVVGIGETGLDYYYAYSDRLQQQQAFKIHLSVAQETSLPIIIHMRDAEEDTLRLLQEACAVKPFKGLIHCFTASLEFAKAVIDLGLYISISGIVTFKNTTSLREVVCHIPLDKLLIETDAPYLAPLPHRGKRNEHAFIVHTAAVLADTIGVDIDTLANATTKNFYTLFDKVSLYQQDVP
jgi:TatD DNase family protein